MPTRFALLAAILSLAPVGCQRPPATPEPVGVVVVTAEYPGANAQVVDETVGAPIELQMRGAEGLIRLESQSTHDGKYVARAYFDSKTAPGAAAALIDNRVALANPMLPDAARAVGITVQAGTLEDESQTLRLGITDHHTLGWAAATARAEEIRNRLVSAGALTSADTFPKFEEQRRFKLDQERCGQYCLTAEEQWKAYRMGNGCRKADDLKNMFIREDLPLREIASVETFTAPSACCRLNRHAVVWITGTLPPGNATARRIECRELAEAELKQRPGDGTFGVEVASRK